MNFKYLLIVAITFSIAINKVSAQLPAGSYGQDFTVTDQFGDSHNLYNYLNAGYTVFLEVSATWTGPSWNYFLSSALNDLYTNHGPVGAPGVSATTSDDVMVIWIEGDASTNDADMNGVGPNTQGNWLNPTGTPIEFPMANPSAAETNQIITDYAIAYYPTIYRICPNRIVTEVGQLDGAGLYATVQACPPPAFQANDPAILSYEGDSGTCGNANVAVLMQNMGTSPLTACTFTVTGGNTPLVYNWTGNLATYETEIVNLGTVNLIESSNLYILITSADDNTGNNEIVAPISFAVEGTTQIKIEISFDSYPEESSWFIADESWNIVASADYGTSSAAPNSTIIENITLPSTGCYTFAAVDSYGDGFGAGQENNPAGLTVTSLNSDGTIFSTLLSIAGNNNFSFDYTKINITSSGQIPPGCNDPSACNYNASDVSSTTCQYPGCTNISACNYDANAGCDNGSCILINSPCNDNNPNTLNDVYTSACNCSGSAFSYGNLDNNTVALCSGENTQIAMIYEPVGLPSYSLQWYYKSGNVNAPIGGSTAGWIAIPGATTSVVDVNSFVGSRTYACFVTTDGSSGLTSQWANGVSYVNYSSINAQAIIGNPNIIPFNNYTYAVTSLVGNTYNWTVTNGAVISGQGTSVVSILWGQNGPYQVILTESDGTCSGTSVLFAVNNNCTLTVSAASGTTTSFCSGASVQLQAATTATNITYQWYLNGVAIAGETNQNTTATLGGNYQVSITQNGCSAISQILAITELPGITTPTLIVDQANAGCSGSDATVSLTDANYSNISWSNGTLNASSITVSESGSYAVTVTDNNGCTATSSPVEVNLSLVSVVPICLVTVDETTGKNNVVWEPITSDLINSYVILKETNVANEYAQIGTVAYGSNGLFEDVNANPQVQANRYKLALIDTCGILSSNSDFHKTIHLATNQGLGNNVNLIWSGYEGFDFGSYNIYRGASAGTMTLLTTIASNLDSYTDINPPVGEVYYMIEVEGVSCDPQRTLVYSHSNILDASVGVNEYASSIVSLFPNPATTSINLQVNSELVGKDFIIYDAVGKVILKDKITSTLHTINITELASGSYILRIDSMNKLFNVSK
jgi:hypothetical protein